MGKGYLKQKNSIKKQYLAPLREYVEKLEQENYALKSDPQGFVGSFLKQHEELYMQNVRLSVLAACLLKKLGETVTLTKEEMEAFKQDRINIKWEIADGTTPEMATEYAFSFELVPANSKVNPVNPSFKPPEKPITELYDELNKTEPGSEESKQVADQIIDSIG